ncbi:hypothetical protein [Bacillus solitudinis]|uniref:hypothetical protein n=1 Tax=Bacillus solitudinis TaxID=2014074 RepID=UPI000C245640|nr:hypothetical protein [Bacillus solitudinis]
MVRKFFLFFLIVGVLLVLTLMVKHTEIFEKEPRAIHEILDEKTEIIIELNVTYNNRKHEVFSLHSDIIDVDKINNFIDEISETEVKNVSSDQLDQLIEKNHFFVRINRNRSHSIDEQQPSLMSAIFIAEDGEVIIYPELLKVPGTLGTYKEQLKSVKKHPVLYQEMIKIFQDDFETYKSP